MNDISAPRSVRWRLTLLVVMILTAAILGLVPNLLLSLSRSQRVVLLGAAAGAGVVFMLLVLVLAVPKARRTYFQLLVLREQGFWHDKSIMWLSGSALMLYIGTLLLAHSVIPRMTSPAALIGIGMLPLLAMGLYTTATWLHLRKMDELMRKIELESWALSALVVSQGYFAAWVLLKAGLIHLDAGDALLWLGVWLMLVRMGIQVWLVRRYL